jgi:lipid A oxidase
MRLPLVALAGLGLASPALAEVELSFYGGAQSAPHSEVTIEGDSEIADREFTAGWEGRSFEMPPHYGVRATWWFESDWGVGVDFNHLKVYADDETLEESGLDHFEFTDGLNLLTVNGYRRFPEVLDGALGGATPYLGAGLGIAVPYVEVEEGEAETYEYQVTGPAAALIAGVSVPVTERLSVFGEYKASYSTNEAELSGGGSLETDIVTNALNLGVSFRF